MLFVRNGAQTAENEPDYYRVMELLLQRILHRKRTEGSALLHIYCMHHFCTDLRYLLCMPSYVAGLHMYLGCHVVHLHWKGVSVGL
jgi:hypothetical protein